MPCPRLLALVALLPGCAPAAAPTLPLAGQWSAPAVLEELRDVLALDGCGRCKLQRCDTPAPLGFASRQGVSAGMPPATNGGP